GGVLLVCQTANRHTVGTVRDVTGNRHLAGAGGVATASRALDIPVVGLDLMVPGVDGATYVLIEANERPGLANHEPQPTAQRFVDMLFPRTRPRSSSPQ
ncbi:MAG: N-acetylglutaminylglutamine synthetase, partial [Egibacteraceae bacterium]